MLTLKQQKIVSPSSDFRYKKLKNNANFKKSEIKN